MAKKKSDPQIRDEKGRFKKGATGNPGGRPKKDLRFRSKCARLLEKNWGKVEKIVGDPEHRDWFRAIEWLASYAYGKPSQNLTFGKEQPDEEAQNKRFRILITDEAWTQKKNQ